MGYNQFYVTFLLIIEHFTKITLICKFENFRYINIQKLNILLSRVLKYRYL